jgi:uncharacterized protein YrrD
MISWRKTHNKNVRKGWCTLRTFSLLKGLPVFSKDGKKMGEICDLSISDDGKVVGLLLTRPTIFKRTVVIPLQSITSIGENGVYLQSEEWDNDIKYTLHHNDSLAGKMVLTHSGKTIGMLEDVYFNENLGTIVAYEISNGFFSDIMDGTQRIPMYNPASLGKDAIVISEEIQ